MVCRLCMKEKNDNIDFYPSDKHVCKECIKERSRKNRLKNIEYYREYDRKRGITEERKKKNKEYKERLRTKNPEKYDKIYHGIRKTYRNNHPEKAKANGIINDMLRYGKLERPTKCSVCGVECKPQAHHPDYSKPTEVIWLCTKCHSTLHREMRMKKRAGVHSA